MLINLRNALMAGKRLPYDAEVEFLECGLVTNGTVGPYIDTGIVLTTSDKVTVDWQALSTYGNDVKVFGCKSSYGLATFYGSVWRPIIGNYIGSSTQRDTSRHLVTFENLSCYFDGVSIATATSALFGSINFYLFAVNGESLTTTRLDQRVYSAKIERAGSVIFDAIPVRVGTVGYMYDRVSGKLFGNSGTGDFVVGPDVVPVEYIESHGTEWINTGIFASACDEVELSFAVRTTNFRNYIFGCSSNTYGYAEVSSGNKFKTEAASTYNISPLTLYKATFKKSDFSVLVNGTTLDITCGTSSVSLFLRDANFAISCTAPDGRYCGKMLIYGVKLSSDSQTLRSFLPVRVGTEGAMMDVLTRRIYRNAGTGAFGYGNDLKYPIPAS